MDCERGKMRLKWFVGLGNPGRQYESTRHNIGFMALDRFADRHGIKITQSKCKGLLGEGHVAGQKVYLLKPQTYMNLSGESIRAFMDFYKASVEDLIVIYDDLDTVFGHIRLRYQGSAGGHNGIKSTIQHLGSQSFNRIRMGISRPVPGREVVDYVLGSFTKEETQTLPDVLDKTAEAMEHLLTNPFEKTMGKYNA
ncbi:Peptidyl-tRNA hydrolase [Paenibacillus solanacearum]|uniref:Peptidyl-tRNA hydrolase n=1 Tax=Paenibacillus solanacearum TaxID=2048548 RepID=A0A916NSL1_9BACL|nr:Peptidyl-tRNA hydrolase [Paenibacillus solanacearum]